MSRSKLIHYPCQAQRISKQILRILKIRSNWVEVQRDLEPSHLLLVPIFSLTLSGQLYTWHSIHSIKFFASNSHIKSNSRASYENLSDSWKVGIKHRGILLIAFSCFLLFFPFWPEIYSRPIRNRRLPKLTHDSIIHLSHRHSTLNDKGLIQDSTFWW